MVMVKKPEKNKTTPRAKKIEKELLWLVFGRPAIFYPLNTIFSQQTLPGKLQ
jgi:hypothetical protein